MTRSPQGRRPENRGARREQILEEARRVVGERGYYGLTLQDLAQRCGLTNAGLLYHFGSKELLLVEMLEDLARRETEAMTPLVTQVTRGLQNGDVSAEAVLELLRTLVARVQMQPHAAARLYTVLQAESLNPDHPAHAQFRAREAATLELLTTLVTPFTDAPRSTARQLLALMDGLVLQWVRDDPALDLAVEWDRAVSAILPRANAAPTIPANSKR